MDEPAVWIYQLSSNDGNWSQDSYRLEVVEGERVAWPVGKNRAARDPRPGERIICWWAKTNAREHGVIGWGVVAGDTYSGGLRWNPYPPSNRWSMRPVVSDDLDRLVDQVRGKVKQATLFLAEGQTAIDLLDAIDAAASSRD